MKALLSIIFVCALAMAAHAATVTLTWVDQSDNEDGFNIERIQSVLAAGEVVSTPDPNGAWTQIDSVGQDVTTYVDSPATLHCYRVNAFNAAGVSDYSNIDCMQLMPPDAPSGLSGTQSLTLGQTFSWPMKGVAAQ